MQQLQAQAAQAGVDMAFSLSPHGQHAQPPAESYVSYQLDAQQQQHQQDQQAQQQRHRQQQQQEQLLQQAISPISPSRSQQQQLQQELQQVNQAIQHHHHHLPDQQPRAKIPRRSSSNDVFTAEPERDLSHINVVGQEGMPSPAPKPKGPKLKFTPEDDTLLIELKETKNLTWKQIADFFPGRSSGTLQVRYCTKLKAKTGGWNDEMVSSTCTFQF